MSARAMIRSEELICCGSAPQRPISIPPLTPQLPRTVRRHNPKRLPLLSSPFFLTCSCLLRVIPAGLHASNELGKYHCYTHSQLSWSSPIGSSKEQEEIVFSTSNSECEIFLL